MHILCFHMQIYFHLKIYSNAKIYFHTKIYFHSKIYLRLDGIVVQPSSSVCGCCFCFRAFEFASSGASSSSSLLISISSSSSSSSSSSDESLCGTCVILKFGFSQSTQCGKVVRCACSWSISPDAQSRRHFINWSLRAGIKMCISVNVLLFHTLVLSAKKAF